MKETGEGGTSPLSAPRSAPLWASWY